MWAAAQHAFFEQQAAYAQKPVTAMAQASAEDVRKAMARQIEVLTERLNKVDEERRAALEDANRHFAELARQEEALVDALMMVADQREQLAALRAKLPPEPSSPPTAGETLANCKQAIFPQER